MNLIEEELNAAKSEMFKLIQGTELVELSRENVAKVEAVIRNDSSYIKSSDKNARPKGKYKGSTAYWMMQLKAILIDGKYVTRQGHMDVLSEVIAAVDRDNSTHLNADGVGLSEIQTRLGRNPKERFLEYLKKPKETQYHLIKELSKPTHPKGQKYKSRMNLSFASKFCHYACFYLFEGKKAQDNYSIYDNIVRKVLPRYCGHFGVVRRRLMDKDYVTYQETIDDIIKASGGYVSRNGFDHLLWYYFKGRI